MDKRALDAMWDHMRQKYGIYLRLLESIPEDRFDTRPVPGMRTPTQLAVHISGTVIRDIAEGIASGTIEADEEGEDGVAARLASKDQVLEFARDCWARADAAIRASGDEELAGRVANPWGIPLNGVFAAVVLNDEFTHHRGQLYAFARACGVEPPFMWSFDANAPGFGPVA